MAEAKHSKIVYLFGAGATHAELQNIDPDLTEKRGLLVSHVSSRVIEKARREKGYLKDLETVSGTSGSLNIELLISLIENSKIRGWEYKAHRLKTLVRKDIEKILSKSRTRRFYLHKALFELFKAHLERVRPLDIEIIAREKIGRDIRANYGFFTGLRTLTEIKENLVPEPEPPNPFKTWLKYKSLALVREGDRPH